MPKREMDSTDRKILELLQVDGRLSINELAAKVGLSSSPCLRRVRMLERDGVISRYVAVLDQRAVGDAGLQMHVVETPGAAVGDRDIERLRHAGDLRALGEATRDQHVRLRVVDRLLHQQIAEAERQALVLAAGERHARRAAQLRHAGVSDGR